MKTTALACLLIAALALSGCFRNINQTEVNPSLEKYYKLALSHEATFAGERVVGFELTVHDGYLAGMPSLPVGWGLKINNESGWQSKIEGTAAHGANALSADEVASLFLIASVLETNAPPTADLVFYTTRDFESSTKRTVDVHLVRTGTITLELRELK